MAESEPYIFLTLVIPAFDEAVRIGETLRRVREYLGRQAYGSEVIVVDDGSTDGTAGIAAAALEGLARARVLRREENRGKGYSVREGVLASSGRLILFSDADLSTPIEEIEKFFPLIDRGFDVVIGSRALLESDVQVRQRRGRELMGKIFNKLVRLLVLRRIPDTQCGFKLFRQEAAFAVFPRLVTCGFCFDVEVLHLCAQLGYRVAQVPVVWRNVPPSKVRLVRSSAGMIRDLFRIRRVHRRPGGKTPRP